MSKAIENETVWVVSSGSYSDYSVVCACDSEKRAEKVAAAMRADVEGYRTDARVESLPMVAADPVKVDLFDMSAEIWDDGTVTGERERISAEWPFDPDHEITPVHWRWVRAPIHKGKGGRLEVGGTDRDRVRRVFSDRRAQLLAEDAFRLKREAGGRR